MKIARKSDSKSLKYWAPAKEISSIVSKWPAWKKNISLSDETIHSGSRKADQTQRRVSVKGKK